MPTLACIVEFALGDALVITATFGPFPTDKEAAHFVFLMTQVYPRQARGYCGGSIVGSAHVKSMLLPPEKPEEALQQVKEALKKELS